MQAGTTGINTMKFTIQLRTQKIMTLKRFYKKMDSRTKNILKKFIHEPWLISEMESEIYKFKVGKDYPSPIVNLKETSKCVQK